MLFHRKPPCRIAQIGKQLGPRSRQQALRGQVADQVVKGRAAVAVQMGRNLVQQQQDRLVGQGAGIGHDQRQKQRLLLAGR